MHRDTRHAAEALVRALSERGLTVTSAESCTGGLLSGAITSVAGASSVFHTGFVTYANDAKTRMLGVQPETLQAHGAVSQQTAAEMALGALKAAGADLAISVTGIAGPGGSEHKPEGRVCFGYALREGSATHTETIEFGALGRVKVRDATVAHALKRGLRLVENGIGEQVRPARRHHAALTKT